MGFQHHIHWRFMNFCRRFHPDVQTKSRKFFLATINKTRYCSNIGFIKSCIQAKVTPNGFQLRHHRGVSVLNTTQQRITASLNRCTTQIMKTNLQEYAHQVSELTKTRLDVKAELQESLSPRITQRIFHLTHTLNV